MFVCLSDLTVSGETPKRDVWLTSMADIWPTYHTSMAEGVYLWRGGGGIRSCRGLLRDGLEVSCLTGGLPGTGAPCGRCSSGDWRGLEQLVGRGSTRDWSTWLVEGLPGTGAAGW